MPDQTTRPDTDPVEAAIDTVARDLALVAFKRSIDAKNIGWEDYGDLCMGDYDAVLERAGEIVNALVRSVPAYNAAYRLLADRAEKE